MDICSGGRHDDAHEEIVYEGGDCPLCAEKSARKEAEAQRDNLQEQLDDAE